MSTRYSATAVATWTCCATSLGRAGSVPLRSQSGAVPGMRGPQRSCRPVTAPYPPSSHRDGTPARGSRRERTTCRVDHSLCMSRARSYLVLVHRRRRAAFTTAVVCPCFTPSGRPTLAHSASAEPIRRSPCGRARPTRPTAHRSLRGLDLEPRTTEQSDHLAVRDVELHPATGVVRVDERVHPEVRALERLRRLLCIVGKRQHQ